MRFKSRLFFITRIFSKLEPIFLSLLLSIGSIFPVLSLERVNPRDMRSSEALAEGQRLRSLLVIEDEEALANIDLILESIEELITYILLREGEGPSLSRMQALYLGAMTYALLPSYEERKIYYEALWRQELVHLEQRNPGNEY
jgi:hypothetical protein